MKNHARIIIETIHYLSLLLFSGLILMLLTSHVGESFFE